MTPSARTTRWHGMKYGIGLFASAVPTARTADGCPISRATQLYGRTWPYGISRALRSTACSNSVSPRRSKRSVRLPLSSSVMWCAISGEGVPGRNGRRPTSARQYSSNSSAERERAAADTPLRFHATNTAPITVSNRAYSSASPATASTRCASPAGAFTSPSLFRSAVETLIVLTSQDSQTSMHIGFDCAHRLPENLRSLCVRKVLHAAKHHRLAIPLGQAGQGCRHAVQLDPLQGPGLRARRGVLLAAVQLDHSRTRPPVAVAGHVDGDPVQPRSLLQLAHALGRIPNQCPVGAQQRVLRDLLGVVAVARQGVAERIQSILVVVHHALKDVLHAIHRSLLTRIRRPGLQAIGTAPRPGL